MHVAGDQGYFTLRALQEWAMAAKATSRAARLAHTQLAEQYDLRIHVEEADEPVYELAS